MQVEKVSFEWSYNRFSSTNSKVRTTLQNSFIHSGSERVNLYDRLFNSGDRRDFGIVGNTQRLNNITYLDCKTVGVFLPFKEKTLSSSLLSWFALSSPAKPRFDRLKRELLEVCKIIVKCH